MPTVYGIQSLAKLAGVSHNTIERDMKEGTLHAAQMVRHPKNRRPMYAFEPQEVAYYLAYKRDFYMLKNRSIRMIEHVREYGDIEKTAKHFRVKPMSVKRALQRKKEREEKKNSLDKPVSISYND